jgi:hypothetical protein
MVHFKQYISSNTFPAIHTFVCLSCKYLRNRTKWCSFFYTALRVYRMVWRSGVTEFPSHTWPSAFSWVSLKTCVCVGSFISNETLHTKWKVSRSYRWLIEWLNACYPSHFSIPPPTASDASVKNIVAVSDIQQ